MKKIASFLLILNILGLNSAILAYSPIVDELVETTLDKNLKVKEIVVPTIDDELLKYLPRNLCIELKPQKPIIDDLAISTLDKNLKVTHIKKKVFSDGFTNNESKMADYDVIKLVPLKYYTTKTNLTEGKFIDFALASDIKIDDISYKKGHKVKARVENVSTNGAFGVPADLVLDNFVLVSDTKTIPLNGSYSKRGADRSLWVYSVGYGLSWFFGLGLLLLPIRGGHVKLSPNKVYEIK